MATPSTEAAASDGPAEATVAPEQRLQAARAHAGPFSRAVQHACSRATGEVALLPQWQRQEQQRLQEARVPSAAEGWRTNSAEELATQLAIAESSGASARGSTSRTEVASSKRPRLDNDDDPSTVEGASTAELLEEQARALNHFKNIVQRRSDPKDGILRTREGNTSPRPSAVDSSCRPAFACRPLEPPPRPLSSTDCTRRRTSRRRRR